MRGACTARHAYWENAWRCHGGVSSNWQRLAVLPMNGARVKGGAEATPQGHN